MCNKHVWVTGINDAVQLQRVCANKEKFVDLDLEFEVCVVI